MAADRITKLEQQLRADQGDQALRIRLNNLKAGANQVATFRGQTLHEDQEDALRLIAKQYGQPAEKIVEHLVIDGLYITTLELRNRSRKKVKLAIPLAFIKLTDFKCSNNTLTTLTIPQGIPLTHLTCHVNRLATLTIPLNMPLLILNCMHNRLTTLTIPPDIPLMQLICSFNELTNLTIPPGTPLQLLNCNHNQLTTLTIPKDIPLESIHCNSNPLKQLTIPKRLRNAPGMLFTAPPDTQINYH